VIFAAILKFKAKENISLEHYFMLRQTYRAELTGTRKG
jgi:hypothetical protein